MSLEAHLPACLTPSAIYAQVWWEAERRLTQAGLGSLTDFVLMQAHIDHPAYDVMWALAVAQDVRALVADVPHFNDDGGWQ